MASIGISYSPQGGGTPYNLVLDNFGGQELPRSYESSASFGNSANGAVIMSGPAYRQKFQWVISSLVPDTDALLFDEMFRAWDSDRGNGLPVACGLIDNTFGPSVSANVVFITPPSYTYMGPRLTLVSFGLKEA